MPPLPIYTELAGQPSLSKGHDLDLLHFSFTFRNRTSRFSLDLASKYGLDTPTGDLTTPHWNQSEQVSMADQMSLTQKAEARAAGYYVAAVILIYGLSIVLLIASSIKRKPNKQQQDRQIDKYLREFQVVQESSSKSQYRQLKRTIVDKLNSSLLAQDQQQNAKPSHDGLTNLVLPTMSLAFCLPTASNISKPIANELFNCPSNYEGIRKSSSCIAEVCQQQQQQPQHKKSQHSLIPPLAKHAPFGSVWKSAGLLAPPTDSAHQLSSCSSLSTHQRHRKSLCVPRASEDRPSNLADSRAKHRSLEQLPVSDDHWNRNSGSNESTVVNIPPPSLPSSSKSHSEFPQQSTPSDQASSTRYTSKGTSSTSCKMDASPPISASSSHHQVFRYPSRESEYTSIFPSSHASTNFFSSLSSMTSLDAVSPISSAIPTCSHTSEKVSDDCMVLSSKQPEVPISQPTSLPCRRLDFSPRYLDMSDGCLDTSYSCLDRSDGYLDSPGDCLFDATRSSPPTSLRSRSRLPGEVSGPKDIGSGESSSSSGRTASCMTPHEVGGRTSPIDDFRTGSEVTRQKCEVVSRIDCTVYPDGKRTAENRAKLLAKDGEKGSTSGYAVKDHARDPQAKQKRQTRRVRKLPSFYGKTKDGDSMLLPLEPNVVVSSQINCLVTKETLL